MSEGISEAITSRRFSPAMKRALHRLLAGESYRKSAEAEGVGFRDLHRNASSVDGLRDAHRRAWRDGWGNAFPAVWRHHVQDLDDEAA